MIGRGELREGRGCEEDVNSILNTCFLIYCSFYGDFCTEKIILKKHKNGQVLNKPQMTEQVTYPALLNIKSVGSHNINSERHNSLLP